MNVLFPRQVGMLAGERPQGTGARPPTAPNTAHGVSPSREKVAQQKFEAFFLQVALEQALPKNSQAVYSSGLAGDVMRSMLAEQIASVVAKSGALSIGASVLEGAHRAPASTAPLAPPAVKQLGTGSFAKGSNGGNGLD